MTDLKDILEKHSENSYIIPKSHREDMRTEGMVFTNEHMLQDNFDFNALRQVVNVATLPGIVGRSLAMPDIHLGYGFSIGGVAATDADEGVISPGGVGYDINCGVRLLRTELEAKDIKSKVRPLIDSLFRNVPSGVGSSGKIRVSRQEMDSVLREGARWAVENDFGWDEDLDVLEERGGFQGAKPEELSEKAMKRGMPQLGSLGAGNHFLEIQQVEEIFDQEAARAYGITGPGQVMVMIHTGSRGCGYQICDDQIAALSKSFRKDGTGAYVSEKFGYHLPDRQLVCAPVKSREGVAYFGAMKAAANYAWANRQLIVHWVRESFEKVLGQDADYLGMKIVYDIAHNIAKEEEHLVEGKKQKLIVHRKGATRAFGPGSLEIPNKYRDFGQPVIIPGDMGTASYLLKGTKTAMKESFGSTCHGAGRVLSRKEAVRRFMGKNIEKELMDKGVYVHAYAKRILAEEFPDAYKDVSRVVDVADGAGISLKVAKLKPLGVVKG